MIRYTYLLQTISASLLFVLFSISFVYSAEQTENKVFRVGAAITDITPTEFPVVIAGGLVGRFDDKGVRDSLHVRALVVDDGTTKFAFAVIDCCFFSTSFADSIKKIVTENCDLPMDRISVSATHAHSTPNLPYPIGKTTPEGRHSNYVVDQAAKAIIQANANLQPAKVGWETAPEPRHVFCRRIIMKPGTAMAPPAAFTDTRNNLAMMNPRKGSPNNVSKTGTPDTNVYVLSFQKPDGTPLAVLANYSTHYAGGTNGISADYFGVFAQEITRLLHAPDGFVAIMTNGTSGDSCCIDFFNIDQPKFDYVIVGKHVAETAMKAIAKIKYVDWVPVKAIQEEQTFPIRHPTPEQVKEAQSWLDNLKKEGKEVTSFSDVYAQRTVQQVKNPQTRTFYLQAIRIGTFGICTYPGEVFSFTGHDLRLSTPFENNVFIALSNGNNGYLPTAEQYEIGGYTTWRGSGLLTPDSEPKIRARYLEMLRKLL